MVAARCGRGGGQKQTVGNMFRLFLAFAGIEHCDALGMDTGQLPQCHVAKGADGKCCHLRRVECAVFGLHGRL